MENQNIDIKLNEIKCNAWNEYDKEGNPIKFSGKLVYRSLLNEKRYNELCYQGTNDISYLVVIVNPADNFEHAQWFMNIEILE